MLRAIISVVIAGIGIYVAENIFAIPGFQAIALMIIGGFSAVIFVYRKRN